MEKTRLGKTNLMVSRTSFGALPMQRVTDDEARALLRTAFDGGINFYDSARGYSTSDYRVGHMLADVRDQVIIATKTFASNKEEFEKQLDESLSDIGSYIDIYQFHNLPFFPRPGGSDGLYDAMLKAKEEGKIRHISFSSHRLELAKEMVASGLYDTVQFPMSSLATDEEIELIKLCKEHDVGFIAMKALAGGLLTNAKSAFAFLRQYENVVPIWGIEKMWELEEILSYEKNPPILDDEMWEVINKDRKELSSGFCRACGYCLPCPAEIQIPMTARMALLLGRARWQSFITEEWQNEMHKIRNCTDCGHCIKNCPYNLDTPALLRENLEFYEKFATEHKA
ncbi:MAG: aldo/keto reductase [Oscillospiraceae bacterium]|nr:aldo/keto reductase [Oscillospiraceae bacterium]